MTTGDALKAKATAAYKRALADSYEDLDATGARWNRIEANQHEVSAAEFLALPSEGQQVGNGAELVPIGADAGQKPGLVETVRTNPDLVTARASLDRLSLAAGTGALDLAVDAAETIQAKNSLEKALAHQMAAAHSLAMKFIAKAEHQLGQVSTWNDVPRQQMASIEAARLAGTATRLMDIYQRAMLTLDRLRNGGKQVMTVQHVTVEGGAQAVINGQVRTGRARGRGERKK
jgi:hypothetical protein